MDFELHDFGVFFLFGFGAKALPGEFAFEEVEEDVAERFQIVAATLLHA